MLRNIEGCPRRAHQSARHLTIWNVNVKMIVESTFYDMLNPFCNWMFGPHLNTFYFVFALLGWIRLRWSHFQSINLKENSPTEGEGGSHLLRGGRESPTEGEGGRGMTWCKWDQFWTEAKPSKSSFRWFYTLKQRFPNICFGDSFFLRFSFITHSNLHRLYRPIGSLT